MGVTAGAHIAVNCRRSGASQGELPGQLGGRDRPWSVIFCGLFGIITAAILKRRAVLNEA